MLPNYSGICKKYIETSIHFYGVVDDSLHRLLVCSIEFSSVDFDGGIQRCEFALVSLEMRVIVVADIDCFCSVKGKLVSGCSSNSKR